MGDETSHKGHKAVMIFLFALLAYAVLPVFGVGFYRNGSGQLFFQLFLDQNFHGATFDDSHLLCNIHKKSFEFRRLSDLE